MSQISVQGKPAEKQWRLRRSRGWAAMLGAMLACGLGALPATATAAKTYVVDNLGDATTESGCASAVAVDCSLREAIVTANNDQEESTIEFSVAGTIEPEAALPVVGSVMTIDATSAPGYAGSPVVGIDGDLAGFADGLAVSAEGSLVEGLAIGGFSGSGIWLGGDEITVCGNYLGTDLAGTAANPNGIGVEVDFNFEGSNDDNAIGSGCAIGNLLSGNEESGVLDWGVGTRIGNNLIGTDAAGTAPLPNGGIPAASEPWGGIRAGGSETMIGGVGEGNTIAYNEGPGFGGGIVVDGGVGVSIRGNSIFSNGGQGIGFRFVVPPPVPTLEGVASTQGVSTIVTGSLTGEPSEVVALDFFAGEECDESGSGEGQTYLGSGTVETDGAGLASFEAVLPTQPAGAVLTATATEAVSGSTSEFSACIVAPVPTVLPGPPSTGGPVVLISKAPVPVNGETLAVAPAAGKVWVRRPGQKKATLLKEGQTIPVGSVVDATHGKVTLTSVNAAGEEQTAVFYGGRFLVSQQEGSGLVVLSLRGGSLSACGAGASSSGRKGRSLWGSGKGKFRTEGNNGSATVRGTVWFTEDRCDGTFFKVRKGVVTVRDFFAKTTFALTAGKSYLAKSP